MQTFEEWFTQLRSQEGFSNAGICEQTAIAAWEAALATAKIQISDLERRIRELELSLAAQKLEWEKAYDIGVTCKHSLAAERGVSDKLVAALQELEAMRKPAQWAKGRATLAEVAAIRAKQSLDK